MPHGVFAWAVLAAAVAAAAGVAGAAWWWRRRVARPLLRRWRRRTTPRYPVVLAHGLLGFDEIRVAGNRHDYFRGVSARLERDGCVVHRCRVARTGSIADRAAELARFIEAIPAKRVNVVAHSMGGLDARFAISRLGLGRKVASLVTVGTPHAGTPLADAGTALARRSLALGALQRLGVNVDAFHDLTVARLAGFNRAVPDVRGVLYGCVVGAPAGPAAVTPVLVPTHRWLLEAAGANDGLVPVASQRRGELIREIDADHFAQIGWTRRFDALELYAELLRELLGRGL